MVFVLDAHQQPLMPCTEKRARLLLARQRAVVHRMFPFTIRLKDRLVATSALQTIRLKLDPGSKETGVAITLAGVHGTKVVFFGVVVHKVGITQRLTARRSVRRGRRARHTRYRPTRFLNRRRPPGWLPPSLTARVDQTLHVVARMRRALPVAALTVEDAAFDTQKLQNPEIRGVQYQQGTLLGYEIREYLLEKWGRRCAYCDTPNADFQLDHVFPKALGGSDRVSNLALACPACNLSKKHHPLASFLAQDPDRRRRAAHQATVYAGKDPRKRQERLRWEATRLERVQQQLQTPLHDAAFMNATRWRLAEALQATGLPVERSPGGRTKMQRIGHHLPKTHYYDALCVGPSTPAAFAHLPAYVQIWSATGRGTRKICGTDAYGFPIRHRDRHRVHFGFQTGDFVRADVLRGKYQGAWTGRLTTRARGDFVIKTPGQAVAVSHRACQMLQRKDGWAYAHQTRSA